MDLVPKAELSLLQLLCRATQTKTCSTMLPFIRLIVSLSTGWNRLSNNTKNEYSKENHSRALLACSLTNNLHEDV